MARREPPYPIRTLRLTVPRTTGADVAAVQKRLHGLYVDGEYGPATAASVKDWQWRVGYHDSEAKGALSPAQHLVLIGLRKRTTVMIARTAARKAKGVLQRFKPPKVINLGPLTLAEAKKYIGVTESPPGSNKVPVLTRLAVRLGVKGWIATMGYPWCALFAFLSALSTGKSKSAHAGLVDYAFNVLYTPTIVAAARARQHGMTTVPANQVRPGDMALIDFPGGDPTVDHIEVVEVPPSGNEFVSIGGNTSPGDSGSQANGGGVFRRRRYVSQVREFVRIT